MFQPLKPPPKAPWKVSCVPRLTQLTWYRNTTLIKSVAKHQQHNWIWLFPGVSQLLHIILLLSLTRTQKHTARANGSHGASQQIQGALQVWNNLPQISPVLAHIYMAAARAHLVLQTFTLGCFLFPWFHFWYCKPFQTEEKYLFERTD